VPVRGSGVASPAPVYDNVPLPEFHTPTSHPVPAQGDHPKIRAVHMEKRLGRILAVVKVQGWATSYS